MNPRLSQNYGNELYRFLKREEEFRPNVYACSRHVPTIGVGYALAEKNRNTFRPRSGLDDDLAHIGLSLTNADKDRLSKICKMLNDGSITQAITGRKFRDPFDLRVTKEQAKQLFQLCVPRYHAVIRQKLGLKLYKELENSRAMVTLFSLAYNAPSLIGENLVNALRNGNRSELRFEILKNSNRNRDVGLDERRKREAEQIGRYDSETLTPEELRAEGKSSRAHAVQIAKYDGEMSKKTEPRSAKRARGPKSLASNHRKRPQPGTAPNQKVVRARVDGSKAHPHSHGQSILERIMDLFGSHDQVIYRNWDDHPAAHDDQHYLKRWS